MNTFKLTVSSPDGNIFEGEVFKLDLRGTMGDLAVMAGHIPFVTSVMPGPIRLELADESVINATCDGGLLTVGADATNLFAGSFQIAE